MECDKLFDELFGEFPDRHTDDLLDDPLAMIFADDGFVNNEAADDNWKILEAVEEVLEKTNKQDDNLVKRAKRPKLDEHTLLTPKGLPKLKAIFQNHKIDRDAGPYENMHKILAKTEYWAHNFYPLLNFDDFLDKVKLFGNKRAVKIAMNEFKAGMPHD